MNINKWSHKPIQTWILLHELSENKKDCYKACVVTYQIGDRIKAGVHLEERSMESMHLGFGLLPFLQTDQIVPSIPSK